MRSLHRVSVTTTPCLFMDVFNDWMNMLSANSLFPLSFGSIWAQVYGPKQRDFSRPKIGGAAATTNGARRFFLHVKSRNRKIS